MKKIFLFFLYACAGEAFAETAEQWQNPLFKAIGTGVTSTNEFHSTNGVWTIPASDEVSVENGKMVLDLVENDVSFALTANRAEDTNTITRVAVNAVVAPCLTANLATPEALSAAGAQFSFAVRTNETDGGAMTYCAWLGNANAAWVDLSGATPAQDGALDVLVEINYRVRTAPTVKFTVTQGSTSTVLYSGSDASNTNLALTVSGGLDQLAGLTIKGSGTIATIDGSLQLGVAEYDGVKYGTIAEAVDLATNAPSGDEVKTIKVLRNTTEEVAIENAGVKIDANGKSTGTISVDPGVQVDVAPKIAEVGGGTNGSYEVDANISGGTVVIALPDEVAELKEAYALDRTTAGKIKFKVRTMTEIVSNAVETLKLKVTKVDDDKLHAFLAAHAGAAYSKADANAADISDKLNEAQTGDGKNGLALWKDYVLGITPTTSVKPVTKPAGDTSTDQITLAIPAIDKSKYSGDYTVTYKVGDTGAEQTEPSAIAIPLSTGAHAVKIVLTPVTPAN